MIFAMILYWIHCIELLALYSTKITKISHRRLYTFVSITCERIIFQIRNFCLNINFLFRHLILYNEIIQNEILNTERNFIEIPRNSLITIFTNGLSTMFALLIINCVYIPVNYRTLLLYDITDSYLSLSNQTVANFVAHGEVNFSWLVLLIDRVWWPYCFLFQRVSAKDDN